MNMDKLKEAAALFKSSELWDGQYDDYLGIKLPDGEIGYIRIEYDEENEVRNLEIYSGEQELESMLDSSYYDDVFDGSKFAEYERKFIKTGLKLRYKLTENEEAVPEFIKMTAYMAEREIENEDDMKRLYDAIMSAVNFSDDFDDIMEEFDDESEEFDSLKEFIPVMKEADGMYEYAGAKELPEPCSENPVPEQIDEELAEKIRGFEPVGTWECEIFMCPEAMESGEGQPAHYEHMVIMCEKYSGQWVVSASVKDMKNNPEDMTDALMAALISREIHPVDILAREDRTFDMLSPVADAIGAHICIEEDLPELDILQDQIINTSPDEQQKGVEEIEKFIKMVIDMNDEQRAMLPEEVVKSVKYLVSSGALSEEYTTALKEKFNL